MSEKWQGHRNQSVDESVEAHATTSLDTSTISRSKNYKSDSSKYIVNFPSHEDQGYDDFRWLPVSSLSM